MSQISLNKILLNVEKMDSLSGILNYSSIENHTHEERSYWCKCSANDFENNRYSNNASVNMINKLPIKGNDFRLKQLFQNLIQNALKYNDKEHIIMRSQVPKRIKNIYFK
jgi:signal transduction histidine kinase